MALSIILVNYNDRRHLEACLSSVLKTASHLLPEIIVVDNASTDGSRAWLAGAFPSVRMIANPENVGFSRANNLGARESRGDFLLFLNTDTVVPEGALDGLLTKLASDPSICAVGPALLHGGRAFQVSFGRRVSFAAQFWQKLVLNPYFKVRMKRGGKDRSVGWLSAACLLCRRTAFEQIGGFDENFFIYFEDIDLCYRLRKAGWRLVHVPAVHVFHEGGATTAPGAAASRFEYRRSQLYFYEKHNSRISHGLLKLYLGLNFRFLAARGAFRGEDGARLKKKYDEMLRERSGSK